MPAPMLHGHPAQDENGDELNDYDDDVVIRFEQRKIGASQHFISKRMKSSRQRQLLCARALSVRQTTTAERVL